MSNPAIKLPAAPAKALFMKVLRDHRFSSALVDLQIIGTEFVCRGGEVLVPEERSADFDTLLKAIFGMLRRSSGSVLYRGTEISDRSPFQNLKDGLVYVMQGNRAFDELTVGENLEVVFVPNHAGKVKDRVEEVFELFPKLRLLRSRRAGTLSAGEKQMLALARGLVPRPALLLLDEPTMGLAPGAVSQALSCLNDLNKNLGMTMLLVEQNARDFECTVCSATKSGLSSARR